MTEERKPLIEVKDLVYSYTHEKLALDHINFTIYPGEKICILGENGAGKSTFFLNLNGVLKLQEGEIRLCGKKVERSRSGLNQLREHVGIVFQDPDHQIIAPTVRKEVSFGPMNLNISMEEVEKRTDEAIEMMELENFVQRAPHYLSGGEKKRVAIADIIAMKPEMFIFDEPTAALDPLASEMLEHTLDLIAQSGKTMLVSTHHVDFAYRWADRIIVFHQGKIIADDTPDQVFKNEEILNQAHLKKPILLEVESLLKDAGYLDHSSVIHSVDELQQQLNHANHKSSS